MLSLEQIKRLENRVYKAVELLKAMKEDNNILKSELKSANERVEELEQIISDYRNNQLEIEQGIVKAIQQLDDLDSIDDNLSEIGEEPVNSALISPETESQSPSSVQSSEKIDTTQNTESPEGTESSETEQESAIPAAADIISDSEETSFLENEDQTSESGPEKSTQQLDIF